VDVGRKVVAVVRAPTGGELVLPRFRGLRTATLHLPTDGEPGADSDVSAVWMLRVDDAALAATALQGMGEAYEVDETVQWWPEDAGPPLTRLSFLRAAPGVTRRQFADHWHDVHTPLARAHHPNVVAYVQNVVISALTPNAPAVDGIAELSFLDLDDMQARRYDSEAGKAIIAADVRRFIDLSAGWRVLTVGRAVPVPDSNAF
jgi:uncharacterized protein (TIGR02118 family)